MRPLIIERPDLQTSSQRYGNISITVACWMVWLYLFVPLLSLLAWVTGATLVYEVLYMDLGEGLVISRVLSYGKGIAVLTGIYSVWAIYNYVRWSGVERRQTPELVTTEEMADRPWEPKSSPACSANRKKIWRSVSSSRTPRKPKPPDASQACSSIGLLNRYAKQSGSNRRSAAFPLRCDPGQYLRSVTSI
jgi:biofilm PGA synthesis protein PgaD